MSEYVQILPDISGDIVRWVCRGLKIREDSFERCRTFGFALEGKMIGGLIFHTSRHNLDVWWTLYSENKRWCNRHVLKQMFAAAFYDYGYRRINILVERSNKSSLSLVKRLGFKQEGILREFSETGQDCFVLGMLKRECPWLENERKKNE